MKLYETLEQQLQLVSRIIRYIPNRFPVISFPVYLEEQHTGSHRNI